MNDQLLLFFWEGGNAGVGRLFGVSTDSLDLDLDPDLRIWIEPLIERPGDHLI